MKLVPLFEGSSKIINIDGKSLPKEVFFKGKPYTGDVAFINGFNGHTKSRVMACYVLLLINLLSMVKENQIY